MSARLGSRGAAHEDHRRHTDAFLGTSSNPASLDGPALIRFLKPVVMDQDPLDRERLNRLLWVRARAATVRSIGAMDIALWDIAGKEAGLPIHRLIGTCRDKIAAYASSEIHAAPEQYRSEEHTSELQSHVNLVCRLLLDKK